MKAYTQPIDSCMKCPEHTVGRTRTGSSLYCVAMGTEESVGRKIGGFFDGNTIPDWCPLPDYVEQESEDENESTENRAV